VRGKRSLEEEEDGNSELLSKNKQKKKLRNPNKSFDPSLKRKFHLLASMHHCCIICHFFLGRVYVDVETS